MSTPDGVPAIERLQAALAECSSFNHLLDILSFMTFPREEEQRIVRATTNAIQPILDNMKTNHKTACSFALQNFGFSFLPTSLFSCIMQCTSTKDLFAFCRVNKYFQRTSFCSSFSSFQFPKHNNSR